MTIVTVVTKLGAVYVNGLPAAVVKLIDEVDRMPVVIGLVVIVISTPPAPGVAPGATDHIRVSSVYIEVGIRGMVNVARARMVIVKGQILGDET